MVNFSTLSASMSPRSANTSGNNGTTTRPTSVEDEKANAKQSREDVVHSMSSEGSPFDLDHNNDNDKESASKASPVVENPFDLADGTKKEEEGPANNTKSGSQAQTLTTPNDEIEEVFMVDVPAAEEVEPPSWMTGSSSVGGDAINPGGAASLPPPGKVFDYFHQQEHDRPSESSLSEAAAGEGSSEQLSSKKKRRVVGARVGPVAMIRPS